MTALKDFLKNNWKYITTIIIVVGGLLGLNIRREGDTIIIVPEERAPDVFADAGAAARDPDRNRRLVVKVAKAQAAKAYAAKHGLEEAAAFKLASLVSYEEIVVAAKVAGLDFDRVPVSGNSQGLIDWLRDHPEFMKALIEIILALISLVA